MNNQQFDALVRRLEVEATASPRAYKARVLALALLGYLYIGAVLALMLALVGACIWIMATTQGTQAGLVKVVIGLLVFAGVIAKSLWVTFGPPQGRRLSRDEAPRLFEEAEEIRRALDAPRADVVLLSDEYNASVAQVPRLGIFGFPRNYLKVGLPLLAALPAAQVRAVLAHEFAHLSGAHGRFGNWIYRVRTSWFGLMQRLDERGSRASVIFTRFFDWYAPYFGAYTFVLIRQHEYEADRLAATVVGADAMAQTLVDLNVRGGFLESRFWPSVWKRAEHGEAAPADVYARLARESCEPLGAVDAREWLTGALKRRTDTDDTHPALRDRLAALLHREVSPEQGAPQATARFTAPAAAHYLGAAHAALSAELGLGWQEAVLEAWQQRGEEAREGRERLAALREKLAAGPLDLEEQWQLASWTEDLEGAAAALPLYRALLDGTPDNPAARFAVGRLMLAAGDESGIALVEDAMTRDDDAVLPGCGVIYNFLAGEGRLEEADRYRERATVRAAMLEEAERERTFIDEKSSYVPSELPPEAVASLVEQLASMEGVRRAYLVKKQVRHFADEAPLHVLAIVPKSVLWSLNAVRKEQEAAQQLAQAIELPPGVNAFGIPAGASGLLRPMKKVTGSVVFDAKTHKRTRRSGGRPQLRA
jgi:Zn-dependent protease with chaperone function